MQLSGSYKFIDCPSGRMTHLELILLDAVMGFNLFILSMQKKAPEYFLESLNLAISA